jgi:hypothetical protein
MAGLPEQLEKMAAAAKSYLAVLRDAYQFKDSYTIIIKIEKPSCNYRWKSLSV